MTLMQLRIVQVVVGVIMLWTIAVMLVLLWPLGLISSYTMGGFIPVLLLVLAVIVLLRNINQGRRVYSLPLPGVPTRKKTPERG